MAGSEWVAGVYDGVICGHASGTAGTGTPWFDVRFNIGGHEKAVRWYFSEKSADRSLRELATLGFNSDFENPAFTVTTPVRLKLEYETNEGRNGKQYTNERWRLDSVSAPLGRDALMRLNAMAKAVTSSAPPAAPPPRATGPGAPPPPPKTPTAPAPPPVAGAAPTAKQAPSPCTRDEAWKLLNNVTEWERCIALVVTDSGKQEPDFTEVEWGQVVGKSIPF